MAVDCYSIEDPKGIAETSTIDNLVTPFLGALVALLMLGLGSTIVLRDFKRNIKNWKAILIGLSCQFLFMPLLAFTLVKIFDIDYYIAIGIILVGCCPGGTTSNLYSYWSKGDVSLSITMTLCSTTLAFGMMPLWLFVYVDLALDGDSIPIDFIELVKSLALVICPVFLGVFIKWWHAKLAKFLELMASVLGVIFILCAIIVACVTMTHIFNTTWDIYFCAVFMLFIGALFGYGLSFLAQLKAKDCRTISIETGLQNSSLAISIVYFAFANTTNFEKCTQELVLTFPVLYSIFLNVDAIFLTFLFRFLARNEIDEENSLKKKEIKLTKEDFKFWKWKLKKRYVFDENDVIENSTHGSIKTDNNDKDIVEIGKNDNDNTIELASKSSVMCISDKKDEEQFTSTVMC